MLKIYGVRFRSFFKVNYYDLGGVDCCLHDYVICETKNGLEYGQVCHIKVVSHRKACDQKQKVVSGFVRVATSVDEQQNAKNLKFEKKAILIAKDCVKKHGLAMKLVLAVSLFDKSKLIFLFTANGRVDFRKLVRNLVSVFRTRVELRQIGIRDEAKILGGIGMCGREFCCSSYLHEFNHVSIKMAKIQNLSLSPRKISGCCGRLMCCLQNEQQAYVSLNSKSLHVGDRVLTASGEGVILSKNLLLGEFKIKIEQASGSVIKVFNVQHIKKLPRK